MLDELQERLGHCFRNGELLERAITHRSYLNEHPEYKLGHNERLEFLGDAVIAFIATGFLFRRFQHMNEGFLTRLRTWLIRTDTLAEFGRKLELGSILRMARGEADSGGRERNSILCNGFEALVGALYLDEGIEVVRQFLEPLFEPVITDVLVNRKDKDPKSLFQEWSQAIFRITPVYHTIGALGLEHERTFIVELHVDDYVAGWGSGHNKHSAELNAAHQALDAARAGWLLAELTSLFKTSFDELA